MAMSAPLKIAVPQCSAVHAELPFRGDRLKRSGQSGLSTHSQHGVRASLLCSALAELSVILPELAKVIGR